MSRTRDGAYRCAHNSPPSMRWASRGSHSHCSLTSRTPSSARAYSPRHGDQACPLRPLGFVGTIELELGNAGLAVERLIAPLSNDVRLRLEGDHAARDVNAPREIAPNTPRLGSLMI